MLDGGYSMAAELPDSVRFLTLSTNSVKKSSVFNAPPLRTFFFWYVLFSPVSYY